MRLKEKDLLKSGMNVKALFIIKDNKIRFDFRQPWTVEKPKNFIIKTHEDKVMFQWGKAMNLYSSEILINCLEILKKFNDWIMNPNILLPKKTGYPMVIYTELDHLAIVLAPLDEEMVLIEAPEKLWKKTTWEEFAKDYIYEELF